MRWGSQWDDSNVWKLVLHAFDKWKQQLQGWAA